MALPETIAVRYTEEEAGAISVRPVVRQTFRQRELLDMIIAVTGKDAARVAQVLGAGTIVFHYYRYWWMPIEAAPDEVGVALRDFPDAEPARPFSARQCQRVLLEAADARRRLPTEFTRDDCSKRGLLRRRSLWEVWMEFAAVSSPQYQTYSYEQHADVYAVELNDAEGAELLETAMKAAPRNLRASVEKLREARRILFLCSR